MSGLARCPYCHHAVPEETATYPAPHDLLACRKTCSEQYHAWMIESEKQAGIIERLRDSLSPYWRLQNEVWSNVLCVEWDALPLCDLLSLFNNVRERLRDRVDDIRAMEQRLTVEALRDHDDAARLSHVG